MEFVRGNLAIRDHISNGRDLLLFEKLSQPGKLAGDGHDTRSIQDYLGHKNIQHTVRYTELSPTRFKDFWRD